MIERVTVFSERYDLRLKTEMSIAHGTTHPGGRTQII
jgi:hypothetical protein